MGGLIAGSAYVARPQGCRFQQTTPIKTDETSADFLSKISHETTKAASAISEAVTNTFKTTVHSNPSIPASKDQQNLGLIIGLSVGIPCGVALIIALAVAIFYFYKKKIKKTQLQIEARECNGPGSSYETRINMSRATSNYYDDVAIAHRNEPVYDNVLQNQEVVFFTSVCREEPQEYVHITFWPPISGSSESLKNRIWTQPPMKMHCLLFLPRKMDTSGKEAI